MQFLSYSTTWRFLGEKRLFSVQNAPPDGEGAFIRRVIYIICITCSSREKDKVQTIYVCAKCFSYWRLGGKRGVPGRGKHGVWRKQGVWWKTRVLSGKHGVPFFFSLQYSASRPETRFLITVCELNISWERKPFKSQRVVSCVVSRRRFVKWHYYVY